MHQGYEQADKTYFGIESFNTIFNTQILDNNIGAAMEKRYSNQTKIKFLPSVYGNNYFILQTIITGTVDNGYGKIKPVNRKETYYFNLEKGEYILQARAAIK